MTTESAGRVSWPGRYFEDFPVGGMYRHPLGRTVAATDNVWQALLTQNTMPAPDDKIRARAAVAEALGELKDR
ncbi:hypothetical protein SAMN05421833_110100 [Microbispora rosea]|uniref:Uncharacterized protein n=1 Tax=Microbispora rosea TaxID=58117 RepID=A0A1N7BP28_9ACTN|nr:hypothetical protein [Microbispora rosea]GIH46050.1 hypothetical protein Mro03_12290 [Microbispora rosea subsp. rosea]SIR53147.1 hypothetical protein SAMN05421833_110100 [Microbispora rosea]